MIQWWGSEWGQLCLEVSTHSPRKRPRTLGVGLRTNIGVQTRGEEEGDSVLWDLSETVRLMQGWYVVGIIRCDSTVLHKNNLIAISNHTTVGEQAVSDFGVCVLFFFWPKVFMHNFMLTLPKLESHMILKYLTLMQGSNHFRTRQSKKDKTKLTVQQYQQTQQSLSVREGPCSHGHWNPKMLKPCVLNSVVLT